MRIIFVHLGAENLGIEYLSSVLKDAGYETSLALDSGLFGVNDNVFNIPMLEKAFEQRENVIRKILDFQPHAVAFSTYTTTYQWCCNIAKEIKERLGAKIIFGGIHVTLVPERAIVEDFVDFVIVGEGEYAFLELVERLKSNELPYGIENIWFKQKGEIIKNDIRPPIQDIDRLPLPDKELFEKDINYKDDYLILTTRGCIFSCTYCCESFMNRLYHNRFFRRRSVSSVMEELIYMKKKYNYKKLRFIDSIFFTDKKWLENLLRNFKEEIEVPFRCFGQVQFIDDEVAELLKWAGCYAIEFGLQTTNETVRKNVLARFETNQQNKKAFEICDRHKIRYDIDHMFGLPHEKERDWIEGVEFYSQLKYLNRVKCHNLVYFPNLRIVDIARRENMLSEDDVKAIEKGEMVENQFHLSKDQDRKGIIMDFQIFYKMLPILKPSWLKYIVKRKLHRKFHLIPSLIVIFLQLIVALKGKDYRYIIRLKYYLLHLKRRFGRLITS